MKTKNKNQSFPANGSTLVRVSDGSPVTDSAGSPIIARAEYGILNNRATKRNAERAAKTELEWRAAQ